MTILKVKAIDYIKKGFFGEPCVLKLILPKYTHPKMSNPCCDTTIFDNQKWTQTENLIWCQINNVIDKIPNWDFQF